MFDTLDNGRVGLAVDDELLAGHLIYLSVGLDGACAPLTGEGWWPSSRATQAERAPVRPGSGRAPVEMEPLSSQFGCEKTFKCCFDNRAISIRRHAATEL